MLDFLTTHKISAAAIGLALVVFFALTSYWASRNAADARTDMLYGHYESAFRKYKTAAEKGDANAQNSLGNLYYLGLGVERDYKKAAHWYERAAINDNKPALINLGILHFQGQGVEQDLLRAFAWFRLGDKAGRKSAETHLKYLSGINLITPNMIMQAKELYGDVASLTKHTESHLQTFERQPHLPTTDDDLRIQRQQQQPREQQ